MKCAKLIIITLIYTEFTRNLDQPRECVFTGDNCFSKIHREPGERECYAWAACVTTQVALTRFARDELGDGDPSPYHILFRESRESRESLLLLPVLVLE